MPSGASCPRVYAYCIVLPEVLDYLHAAPYNTSMRSGKHSLGSGTPKVEQAGGPEGRSSLPAPCPPSPRVPQGVRAGQQVPPGAPKVSTGKRLTPAAKQTVQMMLAGWAFRELAARRAAPSHARKGPAR